MLPAALNSTSPRITPALLIVVPPAVEAERSTARWIDTTTVPADGVSTVFTAVIEPALFSSFRLPDWSTIACEISAKGEDAVATSAAGVMVLVSTWAMTEAPRPILIAGTVAFSPMVMALAVPWPTPDTSALTVPWVSVLPPTVCCWMSRRGMVAKGPT